jgi:hypothetical protein
VGGTQGEPVCEPGFPDTGFTAAIVRSLSPRRKSSRHGRVVPDRAGCVSAAAGVSTEPSKLLTVALWAHLACADLSVERHAVTYYRLCWTISPV